MVDEDEAPAKLLSAAIQTHEATLRTIQATKEIYNTAASLLDEVPLRKEMDNLKKLVEVSDIYVLRLRQHCA